MFVCLDGSVCHGFRPRDTKQQSCIILMMILGRSRFFIFMREM
jgi:hypothetical protein